MTRDGHLHARNPNTVTVRVLCVACATSLVVGILLLAAQIIVDEPRVTVLHTLTTGNGLLNFLTVFVWAVLPATLPMTLVGGWLAATVLKRGGSLTLRSWLGRGIGCGFILGASGAVLWFGAWNIGEPGMMSFLTFMASIGGIAGCIVGSAVAMYCWWTTIAGRR